MKLKQNLPNIMYLYNSKIKKKNGWAFPREQFNASFLFFFSFFIKSNFWLLFITAIFKKKRFKKRPTFIASSLWLTALFIIFMFNRIDIFLWSFILQFSRFSDKPPLQPLLVDIFHHVIFQKGRTCPEIIPDWFLVDIWKQFFFFSK